MSFFALTEISFRPETEFRASLRTVIMPMRLVLRRKGTALHS